MGFQKSAMTNKKILRQYFGSLLAKLKNSRDTTDKAIYNYAMRDQKGLVQNVTKNLREKGESPSLNWMHNIHPDEIKRLIREGNSNKNKPGYARAAVLKFIKV
jgi:hypothetical protein